ncbi:hypothetical protein HPP92_016593 [Vanilla planifolia]|uniref:Uncharacterized protein n=1 Tax=Vanilla planifolia TaxID=51239 RepID=A0A835QQK6_VANPL|nr:hypothetical protein HPP92_017187 [Vanilla planifolia]KAG0472047.1 hypothetical protein HPP92_016593 [Vanilla planifolia]
MEITGLPLLMAREAPRHINGGMLVKRTGINRLAKKSRWNDELGRGNNELNEAGIGTLGKVVKCELKKVGKIKDIP